jgi:hypothetical protein
LNFRVKNEKLDKKPVSFIKAVRKEINFPSSLKFFNFNDFFFNSSFKKRGNILKFTRTYFSFLDLKFLFSRFFLFRSFFFNPFNFIKTEKSKRKFFKKSVKYFGIANFFLFKSRTLKKSRLYFYFKFYFRSRKVLSAFFQKSAFFRNSLGKRDTLVFSKKGGFFSNRGMEIPLNFFLI